MLFQNFVKYWTENVKKSALYPKKRTIHSAIQWYVVANFFRLNFVFFYVEKKRGHGQWIWERVHTTNYNRWQCTQFHLIVQFHIDEMADWNYWEVSIHKKKTKQNNNHKWLLVPWSCINFTHCLIINKNNSNSSNKILLFHSIIRVSHQNSQANERENIKWIQKRKRTKNHLMNKQTMYCWSISTRIKFFSYYTQFVGFCINAYRLFGHFSKLLKIK